MALGQIVSLYFWGRLVDNHGSRPAITLSLTCLVAMAPAWLFLPSALVPLMLWACSFYLLYGVVEAGLQMGQTRAMMSAVPERYQAEGFAVVMYASALGGAVGGLGGGVAFDRIGQHVLPGLEMEAGLLYLGAVQMVALVQWLLSRRLAGYSRETGVLGLVRESAS
jgi:MFS family permease